MSESMRLPLHFRRLLSENVHALCRGEQTQNEFGATNSHIWRAIRAAGQQIESAVLAMLRAECGRGAP